jgi:hypothetical protein
MTPLVEIGERTVNPGPLSLNKAGDILPQMQLVRRWIVSLTMLAAAFSSLSVPRPIPFAACATTRLRAEVVAATKARQVPWSNSSPLGEVFLADR